MLDEDYLEFPGARQVFQLTRTRTTTDRDSGQLKTSVEVAYGITSLPRAKADAARLLQIIRDHWAIENGVFHVRDQTLGEDDCRVRTGSAPIVLAAMRNLVINLLNHMGVANKAAQLRRFAANPNNAIRLLHGGTGEN